MKGKTFLQGAEQVLKKSKPKINLESVSTQASELIGVIKDGVQNPAHTLGE